MFHMLFRVKKRADIIGAFKMDPLYLKHDHQESGISAAPTQHLHCEKKDSSLANHNILNISSIIYCKITISQIYDRYYDNYFWIIWSLK